MYGWFCPDYDPCNIELRAMVLWDSHPEGRIGHTIQFEPCRQHYFLRNDFLHVNPLRCMIAEVSQPVDLTDDSVAVLFTSYMENYRVGFTVEVLQPYLGSRVSN